jgi:PhzF family phenazine biosynthesis protein
VDAFTDEPFHGNPAAVVLSGDQLSDVAMQRIAREFNLSETVFVLRPVAQHAGPAIRLRWFTPSVEVSFCGHATWAAMHAYCRREQGVATRGEELAIEIGGECVTVMTGEVATSIRRIKNVRV